MRTGLERATSCHDHDGFQASPHQVSKMVEVPGTSCFRHNSKENKLKMADAPVEMKPTLGLTGLTMNAMALIAPGAFLWLTFFAQATTGVTGPAMWLGIVLALLLCLATAVCYAELAKLYPGTGSSYYFAEQSFLNHERAWRYARLSKFIVGWASHLYYWIYPGVMVGVMGILCGYLVGTLWPNFMNASN